MKSNIKYHIKKSETTAYPNRTRFINKLTRAEFIIMKQCDGEFLRYKVQQIGNFYQDETVWEHPDVERLCDVELPKESNVKNILKKIDELT